MLDTPHQRQERILTWLQAAKSLSIDDLVSRLGVSVMTIHRDLDQLAKAGHLRKVHGGVILSEAEPPAENACGLCHAEIPTRTAFTIQLEDGTQVRACCPHCGLLLLNQHPNPASALSRDFIYGRMVNVVQAAYVVDSRVHLCCLPSTLCFANQSDAQDFAKGFGGQVIHFHDLRAYLGDQHSCEHD